MFQRYKKSSNQYGLFGLKKNPFSISPLFKTFKNRSKCEQEERIFTVPGQLENEIEILLHMQSRRVLIYGLYGIGKTSLVDFILYLAHNYHHHFCTRVILTQDNIGRSIQEMLYTLAMDIVSEISQRSLWSPLQSIQKWLAERKYHDALISNLMKLMGQFSEKQEQRRKRKNKKGLQVLPVGTGGSFSLEEEIEIRKSIQAYVEVLPLRKISEYMEDFL